MDDVLLSTGGAIVVVDGTSGSPKVVVDSTLGAGAEGGAATLC